MNAYREAAEMPPSEPAPQPPRGLVRANGSRCVCVPPGAFWCWLYGVQTKDRWFCDHGGGWLRCYNGGALFFSGYWDALPKSAADTECK